jgi:hypothetical protein
MIQLVTHFAEPLPHRMSKAGRSELECAGKAQQLLAALPQGEEIAPGLQPIRKNLQSIAGAIPWVKRGALLGGLSALSGLGLYIAGRATNRRDQGNMGAVTCAVVALASSLLALGTRYFVREQAERVHYAMNHSSLRDPSKPTSCYPLVRRTEMQAFGLASARPGRTVSIPGERGYLVCFPEGQGEQEEAGFSALLAYSDGNLKVFPSELRV